MIGYQSKDNCSLLTNLIIKINEASDKGAIEEYDRNIFLCISKKHCYKMQNNYTNWNYVFKTLK